MRHRLVAPGCEWLVPFAETRIKVLLGLGIPYADQSFDVNGCTVRVQVTPGHEYIRIDGGSVTLKMDSGVIDVGIFNEMDPARYLPGTLYKSDLVLGYDAPFTTPSTAPWWVRGKQKSSNGQLSGEITYSSYFTGKIRKDGVAESFTPDEVLTGDPPVATPNEADDNLLFKKRAAYFCPPSMFTGRARLYAQAMFGQYLYENKKAEKLNDPPSLVFSSGPPSLKLPLYDNKDAKAVADFRAIVDAERAAAEAAGFGLVFIDPYNIVLNVSSGVFLDTKTGKHWMINLTSTQAFVYELKGSAAAQGLRRLLKATNAAALSAEDRTHLEAYILSTCRPVAESRRIYDLGKTLNPYSMGYGWHWNWSGTATDMVVNNQFQQGSSFFGNTFGMESTHHRINLSATTADGVTEFSFRSLTVEGPTRWAVYRKSWCITNPSWVNRQLNPESIWPVYWTEKTTAMDSEFMVASGFFYVFYKGDEVQVCRVSTTETGYTPAVDRTSSKYYWSPTLGYIRNTYGLDDGFHEHTDIVSPYKTCTFSVGGDYVGTVTYGREEGGYEESIHGKTDMGYGPWGFTNTFLEENWLYYGDAVDGVYPHAVAPGFISFVNEHTVRMMKTQGGFAKEWYESIAVAVPHYDAEAVYTRKYTRFDDRKLSRANEYWSADRGFLTSSCTTDTPPWSIDEDGNYVPISNRQPSSGGYTKRQSSFPGWWTTTYAPADTTPDETITTETVEEKLYYRGGVKPAILGGDGWLLGDIFSTGPDLDIILAMYPLRSSVDFSNPVALGLVGPTGTTKTDGNLALVGWA